LLQAAAVAAAAGGDVDDAVDEDARAADWKSPQLQVHPLETTSLTPTLADSPATEFSRRWVLSAAPELAAAVALQLFVRTVITVRHTTCQISSDQTQSMYVIDFAPLTNCFHYKDIILKCC